MKVGIDVDGVIANFTSGFARCINELYPDRIADPYYEPSDWWWSDVVTREEVDKAFQHACDKKDFWLSRPPYLENVFALMDVVRDKQDVDFFFITHRTHKTLSPLAQTQRWLAARGLLRDNSTCIVVPRTEHKVKLFEMLGIGFSIDDKVENVDEALTLQGHKAFLLDRKWNRSASHLDSVRVQSMKEFLKAIGLSS